MFDALKPALGRILRDLVDAAGRPGRRVDPDGRRTTDRPGRRVRSDRPTASRGPERRPESAGQRPSSDYPGDYAGMPHVTYAPHSDQVADPGEVVWTWVPYEEDHSEGKDRPVLVVGRDREWLLALPLTSRDHDRDARQEAAEGRFWLDLGRGPWDAAGRASEVRVNRVVRVDPARVRRVSGRLDEARFRRVAEAMRQHL